MRDEDQKKFERLNLLQSKKAIFEGLPHLYGYKDYTWSKQFIESTNRLCFLTAANQIGKSTIQIRKMIHWATAPDLWPRLWAQTPRMFWVFYPSKETATLEFSTKWIYILPQGEFKNHPQYGWSPVWDGKKIQGIKFNSGIYLAFRTYAMDVENIQSGTCSYIGLDEEAPPEIMGELFFRLAATNGYLSAVFTATTGHEYWRLVMEERGTKHEKFPNADKWQVSMYDCLKFADGSPSHWTEDRIKEVEMRCGSEAEILMRVFGRFVVAEGRMFGEFSIKENMRTGGKIPRDWMIYAGIDYGSGGEKGHPSAIAFVAVHPDFTQGRVVKVWRGDGIQTDASFVLQKYQEMKAEFIGQGLSFVTGRYDYACRDLFTIATRVGEPLQQAEKLHSVGKPIMNSLFKTRMLSLDEEDEEMMKLATELSSLREDAIKTTAKDDLADALRYAVALIPWNYTSAFSVDGKPDSYIAPKPKKTDEELRRERFMEQPRAEDEIQEEFEEWNEAYGY